MICGKPMPEIVCTEAYYHSGPCLSYAEQRLRAIANYPDDDSEAMRAMAKNSLGPNRGTPPVTPAPQWIEPRDGVTPTTFWAGPWRFLGNLLFAALSTLTFTSMVGFMVVLKGWVYTLVFCLGMALIPIVLLSIAWVLDKAYRALRS